jgi:hypothetical protein
MVAVTGEDPLFWTVKAGISPVPLAASPMAGVLFVQAYVVAPRVLVVVKLTAVEDVPLHMTWLSGGFTCPPGFTVMVKLVVGPGQDVEPFVKVGVTVIVAVTGAELVLLAVKEGTVPVPLAASPIVGWLLLQA